MVGFFEFKAKCAMIINSPRIAKWQNLISNRLGTPANRSNINLDIKTGWEQPPNHMKQPTEDPEHQPLECIGKLTKINALATRDCARWSRSRLLCCPDAFETWELGEFVRITELPKISKSCAKYSKCKFVSNHLAESDTKNAIFQDVRVLDKAGLKWMIDPKFI